MSTIRRDVQLIITAKEQGAKAIETVADALELLFNNQAKAGSGAERTQTQMAELGQAVVALERAYSSIDGSAKRADAAWQRQQNTLKDTRAQLEAVRAQAGNVAGAIQAEQVKIVDATLAGADTSGSIARIKAAQAALVGLQAQEAKLTATVRTQEAALGEARNSLQQLGSVANAAEAALEGVGTAGERESLKAAIAIDKETAALRDRAAAAREEANASAAQNRFNAFAGVSDTASKSARDSASVFEPWLREQEEARKKADALSATLEREAAALRDTAAAAREAANASEAQGRFNAFAGVSDSSSKSARDSASVFEAELGALERNAAAAARLRAQIDPLGEVQEGLNRELAKARDLYRAGAITAEELALAEKVLAAEAQHTADALKRSGRGEKGAAGLFGLKPYELTNLTYQINDVFTQLASGTGIMQVLAQQGGQILQLFPKVGSAIVAALTNPVVLGAVAAIGLLVVAVSRANAEAQRLRVFEGTLSSIGDGARYAARDLQVVSDNLQRIGLSAQQAVAILKTLVRDGINPAYLQDFGRTAKDMAEVLGVDATDAAKQLGEGFSGSLDALLRLQDATGFMTTEERRHIQAMFEAGRTQEALTAAYGIFAQRMEEGAQKQRGPWAEAALKFNAAWLRILDTLANSKPIQALIKLMDTLADKMAGVADAAPRMRSLAQVDKDMVEAQASLKRVQDGLAAARKRADADTAAALDLAVTQEKNKLKALAEERKAILGQGGVVGTDTEEAQRRRDDAKKELDIQRQVLNAEVASERARTEAQKAAADASKVRIAGEQAYREELRKTGDATIAEARRAAAEASVREQIRVQREREFGGQIPTERRIALLGDARKYLGRNENNAGDRNVLEDLFRAAKINIDPSKVAWCAAFINAILAQNGLPTAAPKGSGDNLRARAFLNWGSPTDNPEPGDIVVLKRGKGGEGHVGVFAGWDDKGNPRVVGGNQKGGTAVSEQTFNRKDVLGFRRAPDVADVATEQEAFNRQLDITAEQRSLEIAQKQRLLGLSGEALLAEQRKQAVESAIFDAEQDALRRNVVLDDAHRKLIEEQIGKEWDIAHAREAATAALDDATSERGALLERMQAAFNAGDLTLFDQLRAQLDGLDKQFVTAIDKAIAFWKQFDTPEARAAITNLESLKDGVSRNVEELKRSKLDSASQQLQAQRSALRDQADFLQSEGHVQQAEALRQQLRALDGDLLKAIDDLIAFWQTSSRPEAAATIMQLQNLRNQVVSAQAEVRITAGQLQSAFSDALVNSALDFAQAIGEGGNAISATRDLLLSFASDFLSQIAKMLLQAAALKLAMKLGFGGQANALNGLLNVAPLIIASTQLRTSGTMLTASGATLTTAAAAWAIVATQIQVAATTMLAASAAGGSGGGLSGAGGFLGSIASVFHGGGIAANTTRTRSVWPGVFAGAQRFHGGGLPGLRKGEVAAILEDTEEVLTRDDPRHILNGGGRGEGGGPSTPGMDVTIVNTLDPGDFISKGLATRPGTRALFNVLRANASAVRQIIGDSK